MVDESWSKQEITTFKGSWSLVEQSDVPRDGALRALNCAFIPGEVDTRYGFAEETNPSDIETSMFNWLFGDSTSSGKSYLVWFKHGYGVRRTDLASPSATNLYPVTGAYAAVFADAGQRFYAAHYNTSGVGVDGGKVYGNAVGADDLFARPMLTTEVTVSAGAPSAGGNCTEGTRNIAFIITTRNGYTGRPSPTNTSLVLQPTSVTTTAANAQFLLTITPTTVWPSYAGTIEIIMTTTVNSARYFFTGITIATPAGGALPVTYTISISDDALVLDPGNTDATSYFNLLTQDSAGVAPFKPSACVVTGNRMTYITKDANYGMCAFISDPNNYQAISAGTSIFYVPGQLEITTAFYQQGVIYFVGPNWTFAVSDTGDTPVNWAAAQKVDGAVGTNCPLGVSFDAARGIGWVAHVTGLYRFSGGRYDLVPVSYMNTPDWNKINWDAAKYTLRVADNPATSTVTVAAPLSLSGVVSTNGTAVTWVSGDEFATSWVTAQAIIINGVSYAISSVASRTSLTLSTSAGVQAAAAYSATPTYNTHLLTWCYIDGGGPMEVKYSTWVIKGVSPAALAIVQQYSTKLQGLWLGQTAAGAFYRQKHAKDNQIYRDGGNGIDWLYDTALFPADSNATVLQHHGADFRIRGAGTVIWSLRGLDSQVSYPLAPLVLSLTPARQFFRGANVLSEQASYSIGNGAVIDAYARLSMIRHYWTDYALQR